MTLPDTPVGRQMAWVLDRLAAGGDVDVEEIEEHMFLEGLTSTDLQSVFKRLAARGAPSFEVTSDPSMRFALRGDIQLGEERMWLGAQSEREEPYRLISLRFRRVQRFADILAQTPSARGPVEDVVREHVEPLADRLPAGGVVVGVVRDTNGSVFSFGDASTDNVFEIGSLTKPFTATLLAEMVDRGGVALDDAVSSFLPDDVSIPRDAEGREVTLVSLATHSASLPRVPPDWTPADPSDPFADFTVDKLYEVLGRTILDAPIGTTVAYSNYGYALLGHALACAAGRPYEELVVERICRPLGLGETAVEPDGLLSARRAQGHGMSGNPMPHWRRPVQNPAGGIESTIADALAWLRAQLDPSGTALADVISQTQRPRIASGPGAWVGLGWYLIKVPDVSPVIWHSGRTGGFTSSLAFQPASGNGVVILTNSTSERVDQQTRSILAALIKSEEAL